MRAIQSELPELAVNRETVQDIVERFAGPMTVPLWFHDAAVSVPFAASDVQRLSAIRMRAPASGRRRGISHEEARIMNIWTRFCVFKQHLFPEVVWCKQALNGAGQPVMVLTNPAANIYLYEMELQEDETVREARRHERKRARTDTDETRYVQDSSSQTILSSTSAAVPVAPEPLSEEALKTLVRLELISDLRVSMETLSERVSRVSGTTVCGNAVKRIREDLLRPLMQPVWLHNLLMKEPRVSDVGLFAEIRRVSSAGFRLEGIEERVRIWDEYCIGPLKAGVDPAPCRSHELLIDGQTREVIMLRAEAGRRYLQSLV